MSLTKRFVSQKMITWSEIRPEFEWDGSLLDIYIHATTIKDWRAIYIVLTKTLPTELRIDGELASLPEDCADLFAARPEKSPMLSVRFCSVNAIFHFFTEEEIECDIDPREVRSQIELDAVLTFLRTIGDCAGKQAILTPENFPESVILRYDPKSQTFTYEKSG